MAETSTDDLLDAMNETVSVLYEISKKLDKLTKAVDEGNGNIVRQLR